MIDKILEMVGGDALNAMTSKAGIPMDQAKKMLPLAGESVQEGLMSAVSGGNLNGVLDMFKSADRGGLESNDLFAGIKNMFLQKVVTTLGLPKSVADLAANFGLSNIIGSLTGMIKADGDTDDIDAGSLMNVLGGDKGMLGNIAGSLLGGKEGGIMDNLADAAKGKLGDIAGGLFGK